MKKVNYNTGRNYGTEQVLECTLIERDEENDMGLFYHVVDASRGMSFTVMTFIENDDISYIRDEYERNEYIGKDILSSYDDGFYTNESQDIETYLRNSGRKLA